MITHERDVASAAKRLITLRDGQILDDQRSAPVIGLPPGFIPADLTQKAATA